MLDPQIQAEFDQSAKLLGDNLPPLWKKLFDGCIKEGFTEIQAMELVKTYIMSLSRAG